MKINENNNINNENNIIDFNFRKDIKYNTIEEKLYYLINDDNIFNTKKTKIKSKDDYFFLIDLISQINKDKLIIDYLYEINISVLKILVNGYIEFDLNDKNKEKEILEIISKIIYMYFNKNIFYFIYKKLSKIFRRHTKIDFMDKKFEKIFEIWKLIYNKTISFPKELKNDRNENPITFFTNKNNKSNNIEIDLKKYNEMFNRGNNQIIVEITFINNLILNLNAFVKKFYFFKLYNNDNIYEYKLNYNDIFTQESINICKSFSDIKTIKVCIKKNYSIVYINGDIKLIEKKEKYEFNQIKKIKLLNYFYGQISSIRITQQNISTNKKNLVIEIKNNNDKVECNFEINNKIKIKNEKQDNLIEYNGSIFSKNFVRNNWQKGIKDLNEIKYFGGFDCFIPLFKILKYIINDIVHKKEQNEVEKNAYENKIILWINDIFKIIIKLICYGESNYKYFKKIIIPLIGALAELLFLLNNLVSSKLISNEIFQNLHKCEEIYILFIIIINSDVPNNIIKLYQNIFKIDKNWSNIDFTFNILNIDIDKNENIDLLWYFSILFNFIVFVLLFFDSSKKVPKNLIEKLDIIHLKINENIINNDVINMKFIFAIKPYILLLKEFCLEGKRNNMQLYERYKDSFYDNKFYSKFFILLIKSYLNAKNLSIINSICYKENSLINDMSLLLMNFSFKEINKSNKNYRHFKKTKEAIKNKFKYFYKESAFLNQIFPFINTEDFLPENELIMNELIDYNKRYHHLMKVLFTFNRLWSNQKLFYKDSLDDIKQSNLKYKNINYYTKNFQRPIIYPVLDYKNRYPSFTQFQKVENLYRKEESEDIYNFDLDCPELYEITDEYIKNIFTEKKWSHGIKKYNVCLVKQQYHVQGKLFIINSHKDLIIYFYSYPNNYNKTNEDIVLCNKQTKNEEDYLCHCSIFKCHIKEKNRKIRINLNDIRMILKRIYIYRKSAVEIFNDTKSYFFNFFTGKELNEFFSLISYYCEKSFFWLNINKNLIGFIKVNQNYIEKNKEVNKSNNNLNEFISLIKTNSNDICIFDIILMINLISNRSYIDLNQYPIFPLLYFYNKEYKIYERDLNECIGFQSQQNETKRRKEIFFETYYIFDKYQDNNSHLFNTHYSNIIYTSNYMIRLIPYSFIAIELQGEGFDDPNRLFYSIERSFYNISSQKSDIRELIPEFFYFPEIFMNLNYFNFQKTTKNEYVDDIIIPNDFEHLTNYISFWNGINSNGINMKENFDLLLSDSKDENNSIKYFIFVDFMKNRLEYFKKKVVQWINIIFGEEQNSKKKDNMKLFRAESFVDVDDDTLEKYTNNDIIIQSIEFGLIPLRSIYSQKVLDNISNLSNNYEKLDESTKNELININKIKKNKKNKKKETKEEEDYFIKRKNNSNYYEYEISNIENWEESSNITFRIDQNDNYGKLRIHKNNIIKYEIVDHNDKIIDVFYNPRLNMFATISIDGMACIYIFPNILINIIKHPNNSYFNYIFLSSNPFPSIITFENKRNIFRSYSLSGILIKEKKIVDKIDLKIKPIFNIYGGGMKDRIKVYDDFYEFYKIFNLPFFDEL